MLAANNITLLEPNVLYLDEKPPKTIPQKKAAKKKKSSSKKAIEIKTISKTRKAKLKKSAILKDIKVKKETEELVVKMDPNDPLYTPELPIKCEINENKIEPVEETLIGDNVNKQCDEEVQASEELYFDSDTEEYQTEEDDDYEDDYKDLKVKKDRKYDNDDDEEEEEESLEDDDDDDDEPLILLTKTKGGRPRKKYKVARFQNCLSSCKLKCTNLFTKEQRKDIYEYYNNLSKEDKINFIRNHIKKRLLSRYRNKKRNSNNCSYFIKYYKIDETTINTFPCNPTNDNEDDDDDDDGLVKICRKFFQSTLRVGNQDIKNAIEGYELKHLKLVRPIVKKEETKTADKSTEIPQKPQLYLDPETGNLTDKKPKTKAIRRKPGEPERERFPRPINCAIRCTFKCHEYFTEVERKQICDMFWSLDFKRRKDFILARIETKDVETPTTLEFRKTDRPTRKYHTRFYLRSGIHSENRRVCKHFLMNTLSINRKFIENAIKHADKTTGNYTGVDGRGKHLIHKINPERKQGILDHINSYPTWTPNKKSKLRCLHNTLSIKKMYKDYRDKCETEQMKPVSAFYYYKMFHDEFRLQFLCYKDPKKARGFLNINPNLSHYSGEEPGGFWVDSKGNSLDVRHINPAKSLRSVQHHSTISCSSMDSSNNVHQSSASSSIHFNQSLNFATAAAAHQLANFVDPATIASSASSINPRAIFQATVQNLYDNNLPHSSVIEPDNDVEQPMGDSSKTPTEDEVDKSSELRSQAASAYSEQKFQEAIDLYTQAIEINPGNALFHAKRGQAFLKLKKPNACIRDCNKALEINCDSAAAYKFRGRANRLLGNWEEAAKDLRQACKLDYDEEADEWLREVSPNAKKIEQHHLKQQRKRAERERKAEELRRQKARQQQAQQQKPAAGGFPGAFPGGFPGGMGGMGGMNMGDLLAGMNDPEVMAALQDIAKNPASIDKYKGNPKIAKLLDVVKHSFPGGVPGFPGGFPGGADGAGAPPPPSASSKPEEAPKEAPKKPDFVDDGLD